MNATKFWISAAATVATAGALGVAIAQTTTPDAAPSTTAPSTTAPAATDSSSNTGAASNTATNAEQPLAQADRG